MRVKWLFRGSFEAKVVNLVVELVNKEGYRGMRLEGMGGCKGEGLSRKMSPYIRKPL